jgi:hypothetical protein
MNTSSHLICIAQQQRQLGQHMQQCSVRRFARNTAACLDALHGAIGGRFMTTVCGVAALMLVPALWA